MMVLMLTGCVASPTVVTVNGTKIDASEFAFYLNYEFMAYDDVSKVTPEELDKLKESALENAVINTIVAQKCKEFDLKISEEELKTLKSLKEDFIYELGGSAKYLEFLKQSAMNDRVYTKSQKTPYYQKMLLSYLTEDKNVPQSIAFTDETLRQYFSENYVKVKYILFSTLSDEGISMETQEYEEMERFVKAVTEGAREPGKDFDLLIEKYNDDEKMILQPEGFVYSKTEVLDEGIFAKVLELEENEIGGPYATANGFYIIKCYPVDAGYFDTHHEEILNTAIEERYNALLKDWRNSANIKISDVYKDINQIGRASCRERVVRLV